MMRLSKLIILVAVLSAGLAHGSQHASAVQQPSGLTLSPAFQMVTIASGASQQPVQFKITNDLPSAQTIDLSVADFNSLNESGGLFFVGTNPTALQKKYGLAKWVSLPQKQISLQPKQTIILNGQILNLPDLSPGGHYGALMISLAGQNSKSGQVGIHPIASSLLFVTKPDGATQKLALSDVYDNRSLTKLPTRVTLRFYNDGNTHLVPRGVITLSDKNNKLIAKGIINENSNIILPQNYRRYDVPLQPVSSAGYGGNYLLKVDFRFDGISQYRSYTRSFRYVPAAYFWLAAIVLLALIAWIVRRRFRPNRKAGD